MVERHQQLAGSRVAGAKLEREHPLAGSRDEAARRERRVGRVLAAETPKARQREHDRIEITGAQLPQTRVDVPAQLGDLEIGPDREQLRAPAEAGRADARTFRKRLERARADEHVARVLRGRDRRDLEPVGQPAGNVLRAVDGEVDLLREKRFLDLLDEARLVGDRTRARVARGPDRNELGLGAERAGDRSGLRQRKRAAAGAYPERRAQRRPRRRVRRIGVTLASRAGSAAGSSGVGSKTERDSASSPNSSRSAWT